MKLDDGFDADNPYHSVALIYSGFQCDHCPEYFSGAPKDTADLNLVPYRILAETAQDRGWFVKTRDAKRYDYLVLCPGCARRDDGYKLPPRVQSPFTDDQRIEMRKNRSGRPLQEILRDLEVRG